MGDIVGVILLWTGIEATWTVLITVTEQYYKKITDSNISTVRNYRSSIADATTRTIDPVTFDLVNVNQGNVYDMAGTVTVRSSGYYYIYVSAGSVRQAVSLSRCRVAPT